MLLENLNQESYELLVIRMKEYQEAYDKGHPIISDQEWDILYKEIQTMEENQGYASPHSPTQRVVYTIVNELQKVEHNHPLLSLDKTKDIEEIKRFIGNKDWICMAKMDGLTCSLAYEDGKLVRAETRGDGYIGEDITHNAMVIPSIPKFIPTKSKVIVDGEIICTYDDFDAFAGEYSNPRNFAAGSIRLLDSKECANRKLTFVAWDMITGPETESNTLGEKLSCLNLMGFAITPWSVKSDLHQEDLQQTVDFLKEYCSRHNLPIDGLVFKYNDCEEYEAAGRTDHHFKGGLAYKFYDELYETELVNIEWSLGRTGVLTPVAIFKEIEIEGAKINRASLHNVSVMTELLDIPYEGQKVRIFRANQIIPQIYDAEICQCHYEHDHNHFSFPTKCPVCSGDLLTHDNDGVKTLWCINKQCPGQALYKLDHFCSKKGLDIKGLSEATLEKLLDWGWVKTPIDIFSLWKYEKEWTNKPGFGAKSVKRILDAIGEAHNTTLDKFISSLGIPLIGTSVAKVLAQKFKTWEEFRCAVNNDYHFYDIPDFGPEKHAAIVSFNYAEADGLSLFLNFEEVKEDEKKGASLAGLTFVITGKMTICKNRTELKALIESYGGRLVDSVSSKTSYLINNDITSNTGKNKTAKSLGIPIITESQFKELLN